MSACHLNLKPQEKMGALAPLPDEIRCASDRRIEDYIIKSLEFWHVPGASVAIVKDNRVVMAKGFGYTKLEKVEGKEVDADTLFPIASLTKSVTAVARVVKLALTCEATAAVPAVKVLGITTAKALELSASSADAITADFIFIRLSIDIR